jgi:hypothetical protein
MAESLSKRPETGLDLHTSGYDNLRLAQIYTREKQVVSLVNGWNSEDDESDVDEEDGRLYTKVDCHENGNRKYSKTWLLLSPARPGGEPIERLVEEKHFNVDGVCCVDVHFALGQPYLSRKHFHHNQRLKSEQLFFVEDERTMAARKSGHWRTYYEHGSIQSELQYDNNGVRCGFCKRYNDDGSIAWVKDYTKDYMQRLQEFNRKQGTMDLSVHEAAEMLGFSGGVLPPNVQAVNSAYRKRCAPLHPDKTSDPDATERFLEVSRAREVLLKHFGEGSSSGSGLR